MLSEHSEIDVDVDDTTPVLLRQRRCDQVRDRQAVRFRSVQCEARHRVCSETKCLGISSKDLKAIFELPAKFGYIVALWRAEQF